MLLLTALIEDTVEWKDKGLLIKNFAWLPAYLWAFIQISTMLLFLLFSLTGILWWKICIKQADNNYITWAASFTFLIESDKCWNVANSSHSRLPRIFSWWVTLLHSSQSPSPDLAPWPFLPRWHKCRCLLHHPCGNRLSGPASLDC